MQHIDEIQILDQFGKGRKAKENLKRMELGHIIYL